MVSSWVRSTGSTRQRLEETGIYFACSLLLGSLKADRSPKLLSGGPLHPVHAVWFLPPSSLQAPWWWVLQMPAWGLSAVLVPRLLLLLLLPTLWNSLQITFLNLHFLCVALALEPSKETERRKEGKWGRKGERNQNSVLCGIFVKLLKQSKRCLWMHLGQFQRAESEALGGLRQRQGALELPLYLIALINREVSAGHLIIVLPGD